jgi:hypothetical protein
VTSATRSGKVKGRASVGVRFTSITPSSDRERYSMTALRLFQIRLSSIRLSHSASHIADAHSYRNASIGLSAAARRAG